MALKETDYWATPKEVFNWAKKNYGCDFDACASSHNKKCVPYITEETNTLEVPWSSYGTVAWCNPPYSNVKPFIEKAIYELENGVSTVMLLKNDTSTRWFRLCEKYAQEILFVTGGRIQFVEYKDGKRSSNNFSSVFVVFSSEKFRSWAPQLVDLLPFEEFYEEA